MGRGRSQLSKEILFWNVMVLINIISNNYNYEPVVLVMCFPVNIMEKYGFKQSYKPLNTAVSYFTVQR